MSQGIFERFKVIDTDTHLTEPPDVWTDRVSSKWGDAVPHIKRVDGRDIWFIGDETVGGPGYTAMAGFDGSWPDSPKGYDDIPASSYDAKQRIEHMDREGIWAQVLYPNLGGFGAQGFLRLKDPVLMLECVRAYNDFLIDWTSADRNRLIPVAAMPFWDVDACVKEVERAAATGHPAVLACSRPQEFGQPLLADRHWDPFWAAAEANGMSISFHIGGGDISEIVNDAAKMGSRANYARFSSQIFMQNIHCVSDLIFGGVCHRYPELKFVSVESGVGWISAYLEAADWQFVNSEVRKEHPEYELLPSEYFRRQIYGCFWFEEKGIGPALELYPDNIMWETDYPHPTCQHPGLTGGWAVHPREYADRALADVPEATLQKVMHDTPAAIYGLQ
ncbi:MAG: amidohydrolase [Proteobacteria bacterium]|nr:amidohydrolase [Pseudomonadota bacterium]